MLKGIGLLLIVLAGIGLGGYAAAGLNRRASTLEKIQRLLSHIGSQIRYAAAPTGELLASSARMAEFQSLSFLREATAALARGADFHTAWREGVRREGRGCGLAAGDMELLLCFGEGLGRTDIEGQLANCRDFSERFGEKLAEARRDAASKNRLYLTLGITGGLAAALLLL